MAEALFKQMALQSSLDITVSSAGIQAMVNHSADSNVQKLMREKGLDISAHRGKQLTHEIVVQADLVLTMCYVQQTQVENKYREMRGRVHRLGKWGGYDILDPYRRPPAVFSQALILIEQGVYDWYRKLWG